MTLRKSGPKMGKLLRRSLVCRARSSSVLVIFWVTPKTSCCIPYTWTNWSSEFIMSLVNFSSNICLLYERALLVITFFIAFEIILLLNILWKSICPISFWKKPALQAIMYVILCINAHQMLICGWQNSIKFLKLHWPKTNCQNCLGHFTNCGPCDDV